MCSLSKTKDINVCTWHIIVVGVLIHNHFNLTAQFLVHGICTTTTITAFKVPTEKIKYYFSRFKHTSHCTKEDSVTRKVGSDWVKWG